MNVLRAFTEHPASVGETYLEHLGCALGFAVRMMLGGIACAIHAVLPFLFVRTGSGVVIDLYDRMVVNRRRTPLSPLASDKRVPL
jgi:Family of unknown function (DUF6356)